jgi:dihydroneopterin triphosphate diphosphatase
MPTIRCDLVDVYIMRREPLEFLQLRRAEPPMVGTWHPVMGHVEAGETATACARREMNEEVGLEAAQVLGMWALQGVHPFYMAATDTVMLSPRFAVEVGRGWEPTINDEHSAWRWVDASDIETSFLWPGQRNSCAEVMAIIAGSPEAAFLHIDLTGT